MKKLALLGILLLAFATFAAADEITFSFVIGAPNTLTASSSGLTAGPSMNILVSDSATSAMFPLAGTWTTSTGSASSFTVLSGVVLATFNAGGTDSVEIVDPSNNVLVKGNLLGNAAFIATFPTGTGALLGSFDVTFVDPAVLALFGMKAFSRSGSVSATFSNIQFDTTTNTASGAVGGGTVTIQATAVPEPASLGLLGAGLLTLAGILRRRHSR